MNILSVGATLALAVTGTAVSGATSGHSRRPSSRTASVAKAVVPGSTADDSDATVMSVRLAGFGSGVTTPRGPYKARPSRITFERGSLWIDHLKWVDWGRPVAYASGVVHAEAWPSHSFITTAGGITIDGLRACGAHTYYTYAAMLAPAGFPENSESTTNGESEQALTPCQG